MNNDSVVGAQRAAPLRIPLTNADAEQLLHDLVATPSLSYHEGDAVRVLVDWMSAHDYDKAYVDEAGNAVGIIGQGDQDVVLLGHIDTFPGQPPVKTEGRLLYGRGAVDAKGPLCTFAVAALRATLPENVRVIVIGAVEEEAASSKGAHFAATQFQPRVCVIGEPSQWDRITLGYKGRLLIEWRWSGGMTHSAGPSLSPAEQAVAYWDRARDYAAKINEGRTSLFEQLDVSLREIHSGQDGAYGHANLTMSFRLPPDISPETIAAVLQPEDGATVRTYGAEQAFAAERDTILSRAMRGAIRSQNGQPKFLYKTGTADMNVVGPRWNCPIIAYGPGDSTLDHTPDEHIDLDEYLRTIDVLAEALGRLNLS
jgi:[amino group carrier protein]-lysine/ornithine hydrolase